MDAKNYDSNRWSIIYGEYSGIEKNATEQLYSIISKHIPYVLTLNQANKTDTEKLKSINPVFIGTSKTNPFIKKFEEASLIEIPQKAESYIIKVTESIFNPEKQMVIIGGFDSSGVLYGCTDFENIYIDTKLYTNKHLPTYFIEPFDDKMPEFEHSSAPALKNRGLWTWGHVIYDYKKYFKNMARLKLNTVTIWNDTVPLNAKDVVNYAHSLGIKIILGYSWGWGENFNISDRENTLKWKNTAIEIYEKQYAPLGGDGIYFQAFTETNEEKSDGVIIAEAVTEWVNTIGSAFFEKYPELEIQFGLHASSVKNRLEYIKQVDPRIRIVWEDCGSFPYSYIPEDIADFDNTKALCEKISTLRGADERFGAVLKGLVCLDWELFEHQKGSFILGADKLCRDERRKTVEKIWKYAEAYWIRNADNAYEMIRLIKSATDGNTSVTALVEDSLFEENIYYPVALFAAMLWDTDACLSDIVCNTALMSKTHFE